MRVVHLSDCYLPRLGGIEVQVSELARRQAAGGSEVHVLTATPSPQVPQGVEHLDGVEVHRLTARLPFELPVHPRTRATVAPVLAHLRPDVVHAHLGVVSPFAWGGIRAAVQLGVPVLATVHSVWGGAARSGYAAADGLARWTRRGVHPAAVSRIAAQRIAAALPRSAPQVLITPNGVDPAEWNASGRHLRPAVTSAGVADVRFVTAMRLAPRKRALPLLRMFAAVSRAVPDRRVTLTIAGDGPMRGRLERFILEEGLSGQVLLAGRLSRPDLRALYQTCDVFWQPSVKESFGLAALEARATGLPVIARSQTGLTEFVADQVSGLLADDDDAMIAAAVRLATDDDLRDRITRHNIEVEPEQVWPRVLAVVDQAYATIA